ncbi:MAG: hypothetical protein QXO71_03490, partial [Candidatus Jordarchaeaceae archaeon]
TEDLMITACDKLADIARALSNKIPSGISGLDLFLFGGFQYADRVAVVGEPRTMTYLAINVILAANKRNVKAYYYTSGEKRINTIKKMIENIGVASCIIEDIANFYEKIRDEYQLIDMLKAILESTRKEGYEGLLVIRDSILKYMKEEALVPKKVLEWEKVISTLSLRSLLLISMFESETLDKETREFIISTFSLVIETRDSPPSLRVLKREQGRTSEWVELELTVP